MTTTTPAPSPFATVSDALGAMNHVEALALLFENLALSGASVPELVASAAYVATERLPRGMSLTDARPGCWESALFESMAPESAVMSGRGAEPLEVDCPTCNSLADTPCWGLRTYADLKHPHKERVLLSKEVRVYDPQWGWM